MSRGTRYRRRPNSHPTTTPTDLALSSWPTSLSRLRLGSRCSHRPREESVTAARHSLSAAAAAAESSATPCGCVRAGLPRGVPLHASARRHRPSLLAVFTHIIVRPLSSFASHYFGSPRCRRDIYVCRRRRSHLHLCRFKPLYCGRPRLATRPRVVRRRW